MKRIIILIMCVAILATFGVVAVSAAPVDTSLDQRYSSYYQGSEDVPLIVFVGTYSDGAGTEVCLELARYGSVSDYDSSDEFCLNLNYAIYFSNMDASAQGNIGFCYEGGMTRKEFEVDIDIGSFGLDYGDSEPSVIIRDGGSHVLEGCFADFAMDMVDFPEDGSTVPMSFLPFVIEIPMTSWDGTVPDDGTGEETTTPPVTPDAPDTPTDTPTYYIITPFVELIDKSTDHIKTSVEDKFIDFFCDITGELLAVSVLFSVFAVVLSVVASAAHIKKRR